MVPRGCWGRCHLVTGPQQRGTTSRIVGGLFEGGMRGCVGCLGKCDKGSSSRRKFLGLTGTMTEEKSYTQRLVFFWHLWLCKEGGDPCPTRTLRTRPLPNSTQSRVLLPWGGGGAVSSNNSTCSLHCHHHFAAVALLLFSQDIQLLTLVSCLCCSSSPLYKPLQTTLTE